MYTFESFNSDTITEYDFNRIAGFVVSEQSDDPAFINMGWDNSAGLLYNIHNKLRWMTHQGRTYIAVHNEIIVAVGCVELADADAIWAIGGIRTWINKAHRGSHLPSKMLEQQVVWARTHNCNFLLLTFNNYNKLVHTAVGTDSKYRAAAGWSTWWNDCVAVPEPLMIRHTLQWAVIKPVLCSDPAANLSELASWATQHNK